MTIEQPLNEKIVTITYKNYRGETKSYRIMPKQIGWGSTQYYSEDQWMLEATVVDRNVDRTFAMSNIISWKAET